MKESFANIPVCVAAFQFNGAKSEPFGSVIHSTDEITEILHSDKNTGPSTCLEWFRKALALL